MTSLTFKTKILLLALVPLVAVSLMLTLLALYQANNLGEFALSKTEELSKNSISNFEEKIYELRREELKNYTELAKSSLAHTFKNASKLAPEEEALAQKEAIKIVNNQAYGKDGYFYMYEYGVDGKAINVTHPKRPDFAGRDMWNLKDPNGVYVMRDITSKAKAGGGFSEYIWDKPSLKRDVEKIGYSLPIERWGWLIGTGLYVDDLENAVDTVRKTLDESVDSIRVEVDDSISNTLNMILAVAFGGTLIVGLIGARFTMSESKLADNKLQQLSRKNVEVQEAERSRVSRQLQSGINQSLVASRSGLQKIAESKALKDPSIRSEFIKSVTILNKTIEEVYRISGELRPSILDQTGLYSAVEALAAEVKKSSGININFKSIDETERLRPEIETAVYRIAQEALKNMSLHSKATSASIRIRQTKKMLTVNIQDNGVGFDSKKMMSGGSKAGIGLIDMRVRAESLGGTFTVFSTNGSGTIVKVEIPL